MSHYAIQVRGLSKQYTIGAYQGRYKSLRESLTQAATGVVRRLTRGAGEASERNIWALKDVSFDIEQGEVVGIIGRNGAGKSTLLKLLARITEPTEGEIRMRGRVGSLLEVGTGFHPELTGRENIFLNGAILGMSRREIQSKFDEIVDFAEIEKFIDTPVKHYSSGMYMRLAFAVAAHLEPEILLVDEVLAVGDAEFQKKCLGKMGEVAKGGRTVLFVSHNMAAVRQLCNKGIVLAKGEIAESGEIVDCIDAYTNDPKEKTSRIIDHIIYQNPDVKIANISVNGETADQVDLSTNNHRLEIEINGFLSTSLRLELEVRFLDVYGSVLALYSPGHIRGFADVFPQGEFSLKRVIQLPNNINRGDYFLNLWLTNPNYSTWVQIDHGIRLSAEGTITATGRVIEYEGMSGWITLDSAD